jgi:hypothetical protein
MPAKITGDHSQLPHPIREIFPLIEGEVCELRDTWEVYHYLFMDDVQRTELLAERFGPLLGVFQNLLQDQLFLAIARLTDKDSKAQSNLSLWALTSAIPSARTPSFGAQVQQSLDEIYAHVATVRKHRHKRIAHFDLTVSLNSALLPVVTFEELRLALEKMEAFLNLFHWEFEKTTMLFEGLAPFDITSTAETTAYKSKAYDFLESEGVVAHGEWRRIAERKST